MLHEVEVYLKTLDKWEEEIRVLIRLAKEAGLDETIKWKHPCYTYNDKNVLIIGEFHDYCTIAFFKGVLLEDPKDILVWVGKNTQADRILKVRSLEQIRDLEEVIIAYIKEAIEIEKSGKKVQMKETQDYDVPDELSEIFSEIPEFKEAFYKLTPGRQRGYLLHYGGAKQSKTRTSRIEKSMDRVYMGKGLNDCICGLSKHMPRCDGSHKILEE